MKVEVEQKRLELEKQFSLPITRHTPTIKLSKLELQKFKKQDSSGKNFGTLFEASIHKNPNLQPLVNLNYLRAELKGYANVISGLELTNTNYGKFTPRET